MSGLTKTHESDKTATYLSSYESERYPVFGLRILDQIFSSIIAVLRPLGKWIFGSKPIPN